MTEYTFTAAEKLKALQRELNYRQKLYPGWIERGKLCAEGGGLSARRHAGDCGRLHGGSS